MSEPTGTTSGYRDDKLPNNVRVGENSLITGDRAFRSFFAKHDDALVIGANSTFDGVSFAVGKGGRLSIGDWCNFCGAVLLCEDSLTIGNFVSLGWNVTITDSDFHPIAPALRIEDAIACSNIGNGRPRPAVQSKPVIIEDDVWIGPNSTILKGVTIGAGSFIEPGSLITHDIPAGSRVMGNPARVIGRVEP